MVSFFQNVFNKGMTSDVQIVLQPEGTYRYMKNCQLISQDGNNYVIKDCLGNTVIWTLNYPYNELDISAEGALPIPILFISFSNRLIVLSTNSDNGGYGEIGELQYQPYGIGIQPYAQSGQFHAGYIPLYHHVSLNFSKKHRGEGFGFIENELVQRIYWTDNFNEPRVFNVSDPIFTTYFASGTLSIGERYMVVEGVINHNGTAYGPGFSAGNVFTAVNANYTAVTGTTPIPKVIKYYPVELLNFTPSRNVGGIKYKQYGSGSLYYGNKMYFYRLGVNNGPKTVWSYGSFPIHVGGDNDYISSVPYHDFVGNGTETVLQISNKSIIVTIDNIDQNFDFIELAAAEFDQSDFSPRLISIVNRMDITGVSMDIEHTGSVNLGELTLSDITLFPASILRCKTMATNKNYIMIGNIEERGEIEFDPTGVTLGSFQYPMNVHYDADSCSLSGLVYSGVSPSTSSNPVSGQLKPYERYKVSGAGTVTYNGNVYGPSATAGDTFEVVTGTTTYTTTGTPVIRPCVRRVKYFDNTISTNKYESITLTSPGGFWDYKDPAIHHFAAGHWSGETYRYGFLPYDKKGAPMYVRWIGDFTFPEAQDKLGLIVTGTFGADTIYALNPSGLTVSGLTLTPELIAQISGFSIVRAPRDARIMCQGIVTQNVGRGVSPEIYEAGAWVPASKSLYNVASKKYTFISPDISAVTSPLPGIVGQPGDLMKSAAWISPFEYSAGVYVRGQGPAGSQQVYTKFLNSALADTTQRSQAISFWSEAVENATVSGLGGGETFENKCATAAANVDVEGNCVTGNADYNLNGSSGVGCKKVFYMSDTDFKAYNSVVDDFTSAAGGAYIEKPLMNYTRSGAGTPYGGTGDSSLANTLYISTGHYQAIDAAFLAATFDGTNYVVDNLQVFGGDCFLNLVDVGYTLWSNDYAPSAYSYSWAFPCECNANYGLRRGRKTSTVTMWYAGIATPNDAIVFKPAVGVPQLEDYSYNPGYSAGTALVKYPALPVNFINSNEFQARVRFSGPKFIGEIDDSFRTFALLDFKDFPAQNGRINNIKVKKDIVVVLQDLATNTTPVLERQVVSGQSGDATTIGTGGVIDRVDVLSSYFGNQHQFSMVETEYGFVWFDMAKKAMVVLGLDGSGQIEISHVLGMEGFFNTAFLEAIGSGVDPTVLLDSPTFAETSDRPLMGIGITGGFDPRLKMTYMTFKFEGYNGTGYIHKDFTIGYLHTGLNRFYVGFFDFTPAIYHTHNDWMIAANNPKNTTQFLATNISGKSFAIGETLQGQDSSGNYVNKEYVCIAAVTLDNAIKYPLGSSGATYWQAINATNQLWVFNQPSALGMNPAPDLLYNSFFGLIANNEVQFVVNPPLDPYESFELQSIIQNGPLNVNYTDIFYESDTITASDQSIPAWSRFYRFIRDKIVGSVPLSLVGRITNQYMKVRLLKRNNLSSPVTSTTPVKILRSFTSKINTKR